MHCHHLSPDFAVSPQISVSDIPTIRAAGFKTVICNRPDGEEKNQPDTATIAKAAQDVGLVFLALPIQAGHPPSSDVVIETQEAINTLPGPIFAYCRTGNRSSQAWTLATQK
ncbi:TIGR01244 family sulfur transferase [Acetobacter vaccinii]|uniref:TIGR01244 family phosphatase n=1 Tax=Acetobacter vaccinii TaxID=2592655 RepID=A0A5C1YN22_9PROT|nr:TIGR01244 family sulfur transferase [Acetobacter vaccinii]QEO16487.1 TIGR01244 family phosphatase [Acetobacter vaccinii]